VAFDKQVQVIGHEAVGRNCKLMAAGSERNLTERFVDDAGVDEDVQASLNAKRQ